MRTLAAMVFALVLATGASAHFVFVVPDAAGKTAQVVFSDSLKADDNVEITKVAKTKLMLRDAAGKVSPVALEKVKDVQALTANIPGAGTRVIYGTTEYGVLAKGDAKPFFLRYHPKAIVGGIPADGAKVGEALPVELLPKVEAGKLRFQFLAAGKPVAETEVTIMAEGKGTKVTTDKDGWTPAQDAKPGKYGAWAKATTAKGGEFDGKKYEESRDYATLVIEIGASGAK